MVFKRARDRIDVCGAMQADEWVSWMQRFSSTRYSTENEYKT